jgi:hypothetical protein
MNNFNALWNSAKEGEKSFLQVLENISGAESLTVQSEVNI